MNTVDALLRDGLSAAILFQPKLDVWIAIRTDGLPGDSIIGDGTRENPWDGSTALKLDTILNGFILDENVCIHLGPGLFRTGGSTGYAPHYVKWRPLNGWKIIGAGQYQTTLLLTVYDDSNPYANGQNSYAIIHSGAQYLQGFELSDLTLDCGMDDQPLPSTAQRSWTQSMCSGFVLAGRNIVVRRVRVVNWGTRSGFEGYPGIFEPIISTPVWQTTSNAREVTPFHSSRRRCRSDLALGCYNEALRLNPKRSFAYVHKARVLAALHRYDEALSVYDMALGKNAGKGATNGGAAELSRAKASA